MSEYLRGLAIKRLVQNGWTIGDQVGHSLPSEPVNWDSDRPHLVCLAHKDVETEVGFKTALAYIRVGGKQSECNRLEGLYMSEGRNILEPKSILVPRAPEGNESLSQAVARFVDAVEKCIDESYARGLFLTRPIASPKSSRP